MARVNGEGSFRQTTINGKKYIQYRIVVDGKQKSFYGKTKTEALKKYRTFIEGHTPDEFKKTTLSVVDVAKMAVENRKGQVKQTTYEFYQQAIKRLEKHKIGAFQIHSVSFLEVQDYINSMINTDSLSTIKRQKICLSVTFSFAEDNGYIEKNFMNKIKLPNEANVAKEKREIIFLSTEERKILEEEAKRKNTAKVHNGRIGESLYGINAKVIIFLLHTGLRMGEVIALFWEDVDIEHEFIHIRRNAPTTTRQITTPKRKASIRDIPLDDVALGIIKDLSQKKCGKLVFHTKDGNMLGRNEIDRTLRNMIKRSGIEKKPTLHDLRHTYASELIRCGVDMKTVQVILGHSDISVTMNTYVHKSTDDLEVVKSVLK